MSGRFNPSCPGPRYVVCALPQGIQERQEEAARVGHDRGMDRIWANCACDIRKYWKNRSSKLCNSRTSVWNSPSSVVSCAPRHVVDVYFVAFVAVSTPTKATKDLAFPAVYCTPPLSMTLCGDYGNETRPSTHLHTALYLPPVYRQM